LAVDSASSAANAADLCLVATFTDKSLHPRLTPVTATVQKWNL
jgi:hypothetical protein